jgi:membrane-bound ClpP family serine protease
MYWFALFLWVWTFHCCAEEKAAETSFSEKLSEHIHFETEKPNTIGWIAIKDSAGINQSTWLHVKNALDYYKKHKPIFIVLELNTPGGEVFAAQKISDALKEFDIQYNVPVVTFINNWAISAGAMLAYSTRFITTAKDGSMGAAEPLMVESSGETKTASEKVNSALRADFANRANFFGRNPYIAEAMVDKDVILVFRDGKIIKLDHEDQIRRGESNPDTIISTKGKLLTLNAEELIKYRVADALVIPSQVPLISDAEEKSGKWPAEKSLLFKLPFFSEIPNATIDAYRMDWKTQFFVLLANPVVSSILFLGLMLGFYIEISTPGFGVPGTIALFCLTLIVLSSFALEIANWLELILLLLGLAILLVELFILPTFGLLGFIGLLFFIAGLFGLMLPGLGSIDYEFDTKTWNAAGEAFLEKLGWLSGTILVALGVILFLARYITPKFAGFRRFVLSGNEQDGYIAGDNPEKLPQPGSKGIVEATLRPSGKIVINDMLYDAISSGGYIEKGESVIVEQLDGSVIVVRKNSGEA